MKTFLKKITPRWVLGIYHWKWALLGAVVYGFPSRKLKVIGVTGTKGKSTVVYLAGKILAEKFSTSSNNKPVVGWISSLTINDGKKEVMNPYHMTMPGRFFIQKTLRQMVKNGCTHAIVEVTSEGIKQSRHRFIKWAGAVFTNLAPEHLEAHGGFAKYREAKLKLFEAAAKNKNSFGVYNLDDENAGEFMKYPVGEKYCYGMSLRGAAAVSGGDAAIPRTAVKSRDCFSACWRIAMTNIKLFASGSEFAINGVRFKTNLLGEFNVQNCAAAAGIALACGVPLETSAKALAKIKSIPGRLEIIDEGQDFTVVVDLAHTPDSFEKVFGLFKGLSGGRIISVFGSAGGGRDKWKRPELGAIASENSDIAIICNEDPYDENPQAICEEIAAGCQIPPEKGRGPFGAFRPNPPLQKGGVEIILDRRAAIARGLSLAKKGDIVLILGKGTEQTYIEGKEKKQWDDREVAREELRKLKV